MLIFFNVKCALLRIVLISLKEKLILLIFEVMGSDEEIDVPNSPLDEYMKQFRRLNNSNESEIPTSINKTAESVCSEQAYEIDELFYDFKYLESLFNKRNTKFSQVLTNDDEYILHEEFLLSEAKVCLKPAYNLLQVLFIAFFTTIFFMYIFQFYALLYALIGLCVLAIVQKYAFRVLFSLLIKEIYTNMSLLQNLFVYLKKVHLTKLNISGQHDVNLKYRKMLFDYSRGEFYWMKDLNLKLSSYLVNQELKNLSCKIENESLSEALRCENNNCNEITNGYNLNTLNCIIKLNYIQESELIKLILLGYLQKDSFKLLYFIIARLVAIIFAFKNKNKSLERLLSVFQLKDEKLLPGFNNNDGSRVHCHVNLLSLHLRNALLNSYKVMENDGLLNVIEYELDFCLLYVKQIKNEKCERQNVVEQLIEPVKERNETMIRMEMVDENKKNDIDKHDFIFEALSNAKEFDESNDDDDDDCVENELGKREYELVNKNFYSELKKALVKKQDEWNEREKEAKVIKDEKLVEYENNLICRENDLLKYKSQLRNRKRKNRTKYEYVEDNSNNQIYMNDGSFLNDFKAMKKEINKNNSDSDEIIYE